MRRRLRRPRRTTRPTLPRAVPDDRPRVRASGPADLLALIPYQLGFHPQESLVAVFVRGRTVGLTARVDLPAPSSARATADYLSGLAGQHGMTEVVVFGYSERPDPARALLSGLVEALPHDLVREVLYVDGSRWWSMTCDRACCPAEGTPYEIEGHRLAAEAVFAGMGAYGSRDELATLVAGPAPEDRDRLAEVAEQVCATWAAKRFRPRSPKRLGELVDAGLAAVGGPDPLDDRDCAELALLVTDVQLRDRAWARISPDDAEAHLDLWLRVHSRVAPHLAAGPLALVGIAAWMTGNGALLNCAGEALSSRHPTYSMGDLLADISARAVPPSVGAEMHRAMRKEFERLAG